MAFLPQTLENLARLGAHLEITENSKYLPQTLESLVHLAKSNGGSITIDAAGYLPQTLEKLARIGGSHVIFRV